MAKRVVSFRIEDDTEKRLHDIAEENRVTTNTLVNQIFDDYIGRIQSHLKFGTITMSKNSFDIILKTFDEKQVIEAASQIGGTEPKEFILYSMKDINEETVLKFIKEYFGVCGYGTCHSEVVDGKHVLTIRHHLGKKGALFFEIFLKGVIRSCLDKTVDMKVLGNSMVLTF